ncbi:MAG: ATP-binding protein [Anaeromyxobacteraceae bacterium]
MSASDPGGGRPDASTTPALVVDERFLQTVLDAIASLVLVLDREGRIVLFNRACERATGYTFEEVRGLHPWDRFILPEDVERVRSVFGRLRAGQTSSYDNCWRTKDGGVREIAWTNTIFGDEHGEVQWVVPTGIDITERRAVERNLVESQCREREQAEQSSKLEAIGRLAGGVAHDFNNLLVVILSGADALRDALPPESPLREEVEEILGAGRKAATLTQQLLAFGRKRLTQPVALDLNEIVEEMGKLLQRLMGDQVRLDSRLAGALPPVLVDPAGVQQVILNLVTNARDAMPNGGRVTISTDVAEIGASAATATGMPAGRYVTLSVRDEGQGMTDEVRRRIFEPFFTTKEEGRGTGLGLATVFGTVKQAGGHVVVESAPGAGSCFKVFLPQTTQALQEPRVASRRVRPAGDGRTVLVVEDDPAVLGIAIRILEDDGYRVLFANDPREALGVAARHDGPIHALLSDVIMPQLNGRELAERLRAERPGIGLVYMSGYTREVINRNGVLDQGVLFVAKPFARGDLLDRVAEASLAGARGQAPVHPTTRGVTA